MSVDFVFEKNNHSEVVESGILLLSTRLVCLIELFKSFISTVTFFCFFHQLLRVVF